MVQYFWVKTLFAKYCFCQKKLSKKIWGKNYGKRKYVTNFWAMNTFGQKNVWLGKVLKIPLGWGVPQNCDQRLHSPDPP